MPRSAAEYARFGPELRRVRSGDRPTDDGGKSVWHQAVPGIEVISFVDVNGRALRQECYVEERAVIWTASKPVCTAVVVQGERRLASDALASTGPLDRDALAAALAMLGAVPPGDRYLDHLRAELEAVQRGLADQIDEQVTTTKRRPQLTLDLARPSRWPYVAGAVVAAIAALVTWRFLR